MAIIPSWTLVSWIGGPRLTATEFPLGHPMDVAVDSQGRIYVAENFYHRVQRYSPDGKFQLGWSVPTAGAFALRTTPDDRIQVATARANKLLTYSADGELLHGLYQALEDRFTEFESEKRTTGNYAARRGLLPHIDDTRTGRTIIATPIQKRLLSGPFPAAAYCLAGLALIALADWRRHHANLRPA